MSEPDFIDAEFTIAPPPVDLVEDDESVPLPKPAATASPEVAMDDDAGFTIAPPDEERPAPTTSSPWKSSDPISPDRALIYAILQGGVRAYFKARDMGIRAEHVQDEEHKVYALFETFAKKGRLPTSIEIQAATGVLMGTPGMPFDVDLFAEKVQTRALFNVLRKELRPIIYEKLIKDPRAARDGLVELVRKTAFSIGGVSSYNEATTARSVLDAYERAKAAGGGLLGLSSPWPNVDKFSLGLQPGELTVILAKRKVGKSWVLFKWFLHILKTDLKPGECIFLVSMEMPAELIYRRLAAIDLHLCYEDFRAGRMTMESEARLNAWVEAAMTPDPNKPTIYVAGPNTIRDVADIAAKTAELNPRTVGVDGLYILGRDAKLGMWERTLKNITETKLDLCANLNVPVVATTQLKGSKSKDDLRADADDAAYAKAIGDYADAMRGLHMDDKLEEEKQRIFTGMESREFRPVDLSINFNLDRMDFSEIKIYKGPDKDDDKDEGFATGGGSPPKAPDDASGIIIAGTPPPAGEKEPISF